MVGPSPAEGHGRRAQQADRDAAVRRPGQDPLGPHNRPGDGVGFAAFAEDVEGGGGPSRTTPPPRSVRPTGRGRGAGRADAKSGYEAAAAAALACRVERVSPPGYVVDTTAIPDPGTSAAGWVKAMLWAVRMVRGPV